MTSGAAQEAKTDKLLPFIASERALRFVLLTAVGIALLTHTHTDWGGWFYRLTKSLGFDPTKNTLGRIVGSLHHLTPSKIELYGFIAIGYGILEGIESYGLFRRRPWGEYLTIFATSLLFIPEVDEIVTKPTVLKFLALAVNVAVVVYLLWRLRRARAPAN